MLQRTKQVIQFDSPFVHDNMGCLPITLECKTHEDGKRYYTTPEGNVYPSMTTVLGSYDTAGLDEWRARVGQEEAAKVGGRAARRGTTIHKIFEDFIQNKGPIHLAKLMPDIRQMVRATAPALKHINKVVLQESTMYSDNLRVAGTTDLIGEWDGELSVIDFKNVGYPKSPDTLGYYPAQLAGYGQMFEERYGIKIRQGVLIVAVEGQKTQVFIERLEKHRPYLNTAIKAWYDRQEKATSNQMELDKA